MDRKLTKRMHGENRVSHIIKLLYSDISRSCVHLASFIPSNVPFTSICLAVLVWYRMADWIAIERA